MGDIAYYYATIAIVVFILLYLTRVVAQNFLSKYVENIPTIDNITNILLELTQNLIIFAGIYIYLLHNEGRTNQIILDGLKDNILSLLPFWFLTSVILLIIGKFISALIQNRFDFTTLAFYINAAVNGLMIAHVLGYSPFKLF